MKISGQRRARWLAVAFAVVLATPGLPAQERAARDTREERREEWQKVDDIFQAMAVRPGAVVADVGAGGGFFTARLSEAVGPSGRVFGVDISPDALERLRERVADEGLSNVEVVEGTDDDPRLPPGTLDAVLIVNAYHEMTAHGQVLARLRAALKPGGRLVIVEPISPPLRDRPRAEQTKHHEIAADYVTQEARGAGFRQLRLQDPFTSRPGARAEEWILVLTPMPAAETAAASPAPEDWESPDLRIAPEEFDRLAASDDVLVLDVRDAGSYRRGHLPGAELRPLDELTVPALVERLKEETRPIVTYCS